MSFIVSARARGQLNAARDWYDEQRDGLGFSFLVAVEQKLEVIEAFPTRFGVQFDNVRIAIVDGFPYLILFRVGPKNIRVISIFHTSRDPRVWKRTR